MHQILPDIPNFFLPSVGLQRAEKRTEAGSDSFALWAIQLPRYPSRTSSERITFPEYREIGLAGFEPKMALNH
jgi:hypothetical protein